MNTTNLSFRLSPASWGRREVANDELAEVVAIIGRELREIYPEILDWSDSQRYRAWLAYLHETDSNSPIGDIKRDNGFLLYIYSRRFIDNIKGNFFDENLSHAFNDAKTTKRICDDCGMTHVYSIKINCINCGSELPLFIDSD